MSFPEANSPEREFANPLPPSKLERYFAKHEFSTPLLACCSDVEPLTVAELLEITSTPTPTPPPPASSPSSSTSSSSFFDKVSLSYVDPRGGPKLRALVAREHGGGGADRGAVAADDVVVAAPQELAYLLQRCLLAGGAGDVAVAPWPVYPGLTAVAEAVGATVVSWFPRWEEEGESKTRRPRFDVDVDLRRCLDEAASLAAAAAAAAAAAEREQESDSEKKKRPPPALRLVVLNFPHNPTGCTLSRGEFELALRLSAVEKGAYVLSDEMYRGVESGNGGGDDDGDGDGGRRFKTLPTAVELSASSPTLSSSAAKNNKIVSLGGLSKWGGCPGLRIGWLCTRDRRLLEAVSSVRDHTSICNSSLSEALALAALSNRSTATSSPGSGAELLRERARAIVARNVEFARAFFCSPGGKGKGKGEGDDEKNDDEENGDENGGGGGGFGDLFEFYVPDASTTCLPRLRLESLAGTGIASADDFCARAREEAGVLLLPASTFLSTTKKREGRGNQQQEEQEEEQERMMRGRFRLGLGRENLPEALDALRPLLEKIRRERTEQKQQQQRKNE